MACPGEDYRAEALRLLKKKYGFESDVLETLNCRHIPGMASGSFRLVVIYAKTVLEYGDDQGYGQGILEFGRRRFHGMSMMYIPDDKSI